MKSKLVTEKSWYQSSISIYLCCFAYVYVFLVSCPAGSMPTFFLSTVKDFRWIVSVIGVW